MNKKDHKKDLEKKEEEDEGCEKPEEEKEEPQPKKMIFKETLSFGQAFRRTIDKEDKKSDE